MNFTLDESFGKFSFDDSAHIPEKKFSPQEEKQKRERENAKGRLKEKRVIKS